MPDPGSLDSSLQLPPTAFPLDVLTSQPGLVRVRVPGWRGQECVCLYWPTSLPLTSSPCLLVSSIPQPMGRAGVGRASSHPVPAPLGGKGGCTYSGRRAAVRVEEDGDDLHRDWEVEVSQYGASASLIQGGV